MSPNDKKWLDVLRQMVSGHSTTQANNTWERLSEHQRAIFLYAAGLKARHCRYSWGQFTDRELHQIKRGLPDVKPGEQLQQQRAEVSQRITQAGDWERQPDQAIRETSMN